MKDKIEMPDTNNCSEKEWTKWYWQDINDKCKQCQNNCKQSWVVLLSCPQFNKIEENE